LYPISFHITATSAPPNGDRLLIGQLIQDAIRKAGEDSRIISGWRDLKGWNSSKWSKAIRQLSKAGAVETVEHEGTYLRRFESLADVRYVIETGPLSPAPRR
jgi:hypothetical protein